MLPNHPIKIIPNMRTYAWLQPDGPFFYVRERPDRFGYPAPPSCGAFKYRPLIKALRLKIMLPSGAGRTKQPDVPNQLKIHTQSSYRYPQNAPRFALRWVSHKATIIETKDCPRPNHSRGDSPICLLSSSKTKCKLTTSALGDVT